MINEYERRQSELERMAAAAKAADAAEPAPGSLPAEVAEGDRFVQGDHGTKTKVFVVEKIEHREGVGPQAVLKPEEPAPDRLHERSRVSAVSLRFGDGGWERL